jgi:PAS domain S-box-containing protein
MKAGEVDRLKWVLLAALFFLSLGFEYFYHVIIEGHHISDIYPEMLFFGAVITLLVLWSFSRIKAQQAEIEEYSTMLEQKVEERTKEFRESEERIRGLVETSTDAIISANEEGRITLWNKAAEKIFGYSEGEALGKPLTLIMPEEYRERHGRGFKHYLETGETRVIGKTVELEGLRKDGTKFPLELSLSDMRRDERHIFTAVIRDITERKGLVEEIKQHHEELKAYASQLEHSNKMKELFTDIMRHDLQNPVAVIKGLSSILGEGEISKSLRRELEMIRKNAEKLQEMIETASKYAKLEDAEELDFQELDLNETLKEVIRSYKSLLEEKKMKLSYRGEGKKPAMVNPMIEDAFGNLLSNAIKYSPEGSEIVIEVEEEGGEWRIAVKDSGGGIPDESKEAIFSRFKRLDKRGVKGTGLGLAIVKRIAELHKGRAWVEDNPEGGSIFYVTVPKASAR